LALAGEQSNQGVGLVGIGAFTDTQSSGLVEEDGAGGFQRSQHLGPGVGCEEAFQSEGPVSIGVVAEIAGRPDAFVGGPVVFVRTSLGLRA
jgi:hypothetical protein